MMAHPTMFLAEEKSGIPPSVVTGSKPSICLMSFSIPILAYYKFGSFEVSGGINTGILLASRRFQQF